MSCAPFSTDGVPCHVLIDPSWLHADCVAPYSALGKGRIVGDTLDASGDAMSFSLWPDVGGEPLYLQLWNPRLTASLSRKDGKVVGVHRGLLTGILLKESLFQLVDGLLAAQPDAAFDAGVLREELLAFLDIDVNGDERPDAFSVGIGFETGPVTVVGVLPFPDARDDEHH